MASLPLAILELPYRDETEYLATFSPRFRSELRPLDVPTITKSVGKTGRLIVVHEGWTTYGISAEVVASVAETNGVVLQAQPIRIGTAETHLPASLVLSKIVLPSGTRVDAAIAKCMGRADIREPARG